MVGGEGAGGSRMRGGGVDLERTSTTIGPQPCSKGAGKSHRQHHHLHVCCAKLWYWRPLLERVLAREMERKTTGEKVRCVGAIYRRTHLPQSLPPTHAHLHTWWRPCVLSPCGHPVERSYGSLGRSESTWKGRQAVETNRKSRRTMPCVPSTKHRWPAPVRAAGSSAVCMARCVCVGGGVTLPLHKVRDKVAVGFKRFKRLAVQ